jgi:hypothetical protein
MQQLVHEKAIFAPIWQLAFLSGVGPRVGESSFGRIAGFPYSAPFEDIRTDIDLSDSQQTLPLPSDRIGLLAAPDRF